MPSLNTSSFPKVRTEALLHRQHELIECIGWLSEVGRSAAGDSRATALIEGVWKQIVSGSGLASSGSDNSASVTIGISPSDQDTIEILEPLGEGSFGKVYKGRWRGLTVAVKSIMLPIKVTAASIYAVSIYAASQLFHACFVFTNQILFILKNIWNISH